MVRWSGGRSSSTRGRHSYRLLLTTTTTTTGDPAHGSLCEEAAAVDGRHALRLGALLRDPWRAALLLARAAGAKAEPPPTNEPLGGGSGQWPRARLLPYSFPPPSRRLGARLLHIRERSLGCPAAPEGATRSGSQRRQLKAPRRVALRTPDHAHGRALRPHAVLAMYSQAHDRPLRGAHGANPNPNSNPDPNPDPNPNPGT